LQLLISLCGLLASLGSAICPTLFQPSFKDSRDGLAVQLGLALREYRERENSYLNTLSEVSAEFARKERRRTLRQSDW